MDDLVKHGNPTMPLPERIFNILLGLSIISWAVLGFFSTDQPNPTTVRVCIVSLHLTVAVFILLRSGVKTNGSLSACATALPAVLIGGWAFVYSPEQWHSASQVILVLGTVVTITSVCCLGKSFAILPAFRQLVDSGPYRLIRHPIYLGELLMVCGFCFAEIHWQGFLIASGAIAFVAVRIVAEENLLGSASEYLKYREKVKWRLVPGLW